MKIIWDPLVKQQIEQIFRFNQTTFGTSKAKHIVESIYQHINLLKKFPLMGTIEQNTTDWAPPYRYLVEKHCKISCPCCKKVKQHLSQYPLSCYQR